MVVATLISLAVGPVLYWYERVYLYQYHVINSVLLQFRLICHPYVTLYRHAVIKYAPKCAFYVVFEYIRNNIICIILKAFLCTACLD